ncbi:MAG: hypothetical protein CL833_05825 [Crocinitomicaceae bacterium]|nr:hypothetical protein [Crocinitomicaceae bacterium]|tara:strand:- start:359 stop:628 length:270 start_codon:yes stop_codon:yes gene_type:complete
MKKMSLNKDGTPRRRRNSGKGGSAIVSLSVDEILDLVSQDVVSIPVSEDWVKGRLYANYLASKKVSQDFPELQSVEDKIEFAITDFDNE